MIFPSETDRHQAVSVSSFSLYVACSSDMFGKILTLTYDFFLQKVCMSIHPMTSSHPRAMHSIVFLQPLHTFHLFSPGTFSQQWASSVSWWVLEGQQRKIGYFDLMIKFSILLSLKRLNHWWKDSTETLFGSHSSYKTLTSVKND